MSPFALFLQLSVDGEFSHEPSFGAPQTLFTFYEPRSPPEMTRVSPSEGSCSVGGAWLEDTLTSTAVEVAAGLGIDVYGSNFAPTSHSCFSPILKVTAPSP